MNHRTIAVAACMTAVALHACNDTAPKEHSTGISADTNRVAAVHGMGTPVMPSATVDNIILARDDGKGNPGEEVTEFRPEDNPLHSIIRLSGVERGTKVRAVWVAVNAGGETNYTIASEDLTTGIQGNSAKFTVSLPRPWPEGQYKVDVYLNDVLTRSYGFAVREDR